MANGLCWKVNPPIVTADPHEEQTAPVQVVASHHSAKHPKPEVDMSVPNAPGPIVHRPVELRREQGVQKDLMRSNLMPQKEKL